MPVPQPCWKLRPIRLASGPRSASSAFCIPGDRLCSDTRTSTVSYRVVDCRLITPGGSARHPLLFTGESAQPRLSGQVRGWITAGFSEQATCLFWPVPAVGQREGIRSLLAHSVSGRLGRLCQGSLWRTGALQYLARYTHRVAISNHRLLSVDGDRVTFRWKDYAHHSASRAMTLTLEEFLRRFLQHVLPKGLPRIRYFGWLANRRRRELLPLCRRLLAVAPPPAGAKTDAAAVWQCPICGSPMHVVELLTASQIQQEQGHEVYILDSS